MAHELEFPAEEGVLLRHPQTSFGRGDALTVPPGKAAVLYSGGAYSPVYRAGDRPALGAGLKRREGTLYLIDLSPAPAVEWGFGGVRCGSRACGVSGTLRMQVVSPLKFLAAYAAADLPLTGRALAEGWVAPLGDAVRRCAAGLDDLRGEALRARLARDIAEEMEEPLEQRGLCLHELAVEMPFFPDDEEEDA